LEDGGGADDVFCGPPGVLKVLHVPREMGGEPVTKPFDIVPPVSREKPLAGEPTKVIITTNNPEGDDTTDLETRERGP